MSNVPALKRSPSGYQVVDTAQELYRKVIAMCIKLPKRYTPLVLQPFVELASEVADNTKCANSVFPHNQHEVQIRLDYWIVAKAKLQALSSKLNNISEIPSVLRYKVNNAERITIYYVTQLSIIIIYLLFILHKNQKIQKYIINFTQ